MEITGLTALELGNKIKNKEIKVTEAVTAQFDKIKEREETYHCYISLMEEDALKKAEEIQKKIDNGELKNSPLAGVPVAVKDNICTSRMKTTCASKMLSDFVPPYDAEVVKKLETAGAIIIGKTNLDEFAMGSATDTSFFGLTKNPWDITKAPGGSSGGSAAAVAAEEAFYSLGSDTGGSIRQPSSFCGVTGIKPTYGTVSRYGLIPFAASMDQIGPIGRTVSDCVAALEIISGYDEKDSTSIGRKDYHFTEALVDDVKGMRIGIPKEYMVKELADEVKISVLDAAKELEKKGAIIEEFQMPEINYSIYTYHILACAEASSNMSKYDGIKYGYQTKEFEDLSDVYIKSRSEGFGMEVKRRIMIGTFALSSGNYDTFYSKALKVRGLLKNSFDKAFENYDLILGPTSSTTALPLEQKSKDSSQRNLGDIYTSAVNLAGLPAISLPCGLDSGGLPIGLQLIGKPFGEKDIIRAAYSFERTRQYVSPLRR